MKKPILSVLLFISFTVAGQETQPPASPPAHEQKVKKGFGVSMVQVQPEFPGGTDSLNTFLMRNMTYPDKAKQEKVQGTVYIAFTVDINGKIKDEQVLKSVHQDLDNEALRVVRMMPDWKPGSAGGSPRQMQYILPFDFRLPENVR